MLKISHCSKPLTGHKNEIKFIASKTGKIFLKIDL